VRNKAIVRSAEAVRPNIVHIERTIGEDVIVRLVDIYAVSESAVLELLDSTPQVNCIVTTSQWNSYTRAAKAMALEHNAGLFTFREFMGAVHRVGDDFLTFPPRSVSRS
jgi:hypothetical protein